MAADNNSSVDFDSPSMTGGMDYSDLNSKLTYFYDSFLFSFFFLFFFFLNDYVMMFELQQLV